MIPAPQARIEAIRERAKQFVRCELEPALERFSKRPSRSGYLPFDETVGLVEAALHHESELTLTAQAQEIAALKAQSAELNSKLDFVQSEKQALIALLPPATEGR